MTQPYVDPISDLIARCGACGLDLSSTSPRARFCPRCGRRLRQDSSVWAVAQSVAGRLWRAEPGPVAEPGPRAAVVVGYGNALWRLGWRYEHGRGMSRNVAEAIRCYHKSAGLGNAEAAARLEIPVAERAGRAAATGREWIPLRDEV